MKIYRYFIEEIEKTVSTLKKKREEADLMFVVMTDSHLDDFEEDTLANIREVDSKVPFEFVIHLGDYLNGNIPREYTRKILKGEMEKYRRAIRNGIFYPVQGNHDGFCQESADRTYLDVVLDEDWYDATSFTENYPNLKRDGWKPYYYVDYPEKHIRLIILCSFSYEWQGDGQYRKLYEMEQAQIDWLKKEALMLEEDWTVMLFSHDGPLVHYDQERYVQEPWNGKNRELMDVLLRAGKERGFAVAAWFIGHLHGEVCRIVEGIPFVVIGSQTCYVPQLWLMPEAGHFETRKRETVTQDLWDAVTLNLEKRELYLCRFGAGKDRVIYYEK